MRNKKLLGGAAALVGASLLFAGCGSRSEPSAASTAGATKTVKIGVIAPLTGSYSPIGLGIRNSVELAIKQANEAKAIPGWTIEMAAEDDQASADVGLNAATKLAADNAIVGVVGTYNSGVAQNVQPILNDKKIVMVSPANTGPYLTIGADAAHPKRSYANYFRVCTTDAVQGPFAAQYVWNAGYKKIAVVNDKKPYGQGLVKEMSAAFKTLGGEIVADKAVNPGDTDFSSVITLLKAAKPELVYFGTEYEPAGKLSQQMKAAGLEVPLMGGDGIYDPKYIEIAGPKSEGDLATSVGAPVDSLASAKAFVDAYKAAGYADAYAAYGGYAYDAANVIIGALKTSLASASDVASAREATIAAVGKTDLEGVTGKVSFDQYGDATAKVLTVYAVKNGAWAPEKTDELK